ncbi:MAG: putative ABC transporter permease [Ruminococcus sp.]|nr:putative ABC transporter permease [Ruminococcus sp.]
MSAITYRDIFFLFMIGNVLGVIVEGVWCKLYKGKWETHVVALLGPFNIVYGIGISLFCIVDYLLVGHPLLLRVAMLALAGSLVEYLCGLVIRIGIRMKAWDYRHHRWNLQGLISPKMTVAWGAMGFVFDRFMNKPLKKLLMRMSGASWNVLCSVLSVFMVINLSCTAVCIIRWANRHRGKPPMNRISRFIDDKYPDEWMEKKFCNWKFIED